MVYKRDNLEALGLSVLTWWGVEQAQLVLVDSAVLRYPARRTFGGAEIRRVFH